MQIKFTEEALDELPNVRAKSGRRQLRAWDKANTGLGVLVGPTSMTYIAIITRGDGSRPQEVIGDRASMSLADARKEYHKLLGKLAVNKPTPGDILRLTKGGITVRDAINNYIACMENKACCWSSIDSVKRELLNGPHLRDWLDRPLRGIKPIEVRQRHEKIGAHGEASANRIMRNFCTVWAHIAREALLSDEDWPQNPRQVVRWYRIDRRREPMPWSALPAWRAAVEGITALARRNYNYLVLLTALRKMDAATLRWEHLNLTSTPIETRVWDARRKRYHTVELPPYSMHRPFPKGGGEKAFTVPLPEFLILLLSEQHTVQNMLDRNDHGWVFPAKADKAGPCPYCAQLGLPDHAAGAVIHMTSADFITEERRKLLSLAKLPSPHRLRDTWLSATPLLKPPMPEDIAQALVNHRPRTVTQGYRRFDVEDLRPWQEKQCTFLLGCMRGERHLRLAV